VKLSNRVLASLFAAGSVTGYAAFQLLITEEKKVETCQTPVVRESEASQPITPPEPVVVPVTAPSDLNKPLPVRQSKVNECGPCGMG
jgi:hypothetical protein